MRESKIQSYLRLQVLKHGGILRRLRDVGATDRLVLWPGGNAVFVELKATGEKPRVLQAREHKKLRSMGYPVEVLSSIQQVDKFIAAWAAFIVAASTPRREL
jgi:hypothetical protein